MAWRGCELLDDNSTGGIAVQSTTFVSSTELVAEINIAAGASLSFFDIRVVNLNGRTGRGSDLFQVVQKGSNGAGSCLPLPLPAGIVEVARLNPSPGLVAPTNMAIQMKSYPTLIGSVPALMVAATSGPRVEVYFLSRDADGVLVDVESPHRTLTVSATDSLVDALALGDVNADGTPDVVAADPVRVLLFLGARSATGQISFGAAIPLALPNAPQSYRRALAIGDLNGAGPAEVLVGQQGVRSGKNGIPGALTIFSFACVSTSCTVSSTKKLVPAVTPALRYDEGYPRSVALADVIGADGTPEIVVGVDNRDVNGVRGAGEVWILQAPQYDTPTVLRATTPATDDHFGAKVAAGEVDLFPGAEILASTSWVGLDTRGEVFQSTLPFSTPSPAFTFKPQGGTMDDGWATTGLTVGDLNGDGFTDVVVGAPNSSPSNSCGNLGAAYLFLGDGTGDWQTLVLSPTPYNGTFNAYGWSTGMAELSGLRLLLIGEQGADVGGVDNAGQVYVYRVDAP